MDKITMRIFRGQEGEGELVDYQVNWTRVWFCSTASTKSNTNRMLKSPADGIARPESAARAVLKSTANHS